MSCHITSIQEAGNARNPIFYATCSCGWESPNLPSHRRQATDDARAHRKAESQSEEAEA